MNAAKAKKSPAKVKGAVLIMILAVMTVMIILLAGSIAVVYSAHNRASVKYSESQGYYTARSVLDNFFSELSESTDQKDSTNASIGTYYQLDLKNNAVVSKPLCIGRSIELELYKPKVEVKDASGNYLDWFKEYCDTNKAGMSAQINGFEGTSVDYTTAADGHNTALYAKAEQYYVNLNTSALSSDSSTYGQFYNQYSTFTGSVASGMSADTIIYEIDSLDGFGAGTIDTDGDGNPDTSSQFGKLSDIGASKAWITVQVTERILAMGEGTTYADRFKSGKRSDDHIVAKVTAHVIYDGEEITTTQIWVSSPPPVVDTDTGLSTLGPLDTTTSLTAIGDVATLDDSFLELTNNSTYSGNAYIEGSFDTGTATPSVTMSEDDAFFVKNTLKINTNPPKASELVDGALFYAGRTQLWNSGASFGSGTASDPASARHRVNLVTKNFESHSTEKEFYGRIFADTFDITTNSSQLTQNYVGSSIGNYGSPGSGNVTFPSDLKKKINADVYCNYIGIPADRIYVEVDNANDILTFKINYDAYSGTQITSASRSDLQSKMIENMVADGYSITVLKGIKIIKAVDYEVVNGKQILVDKYEQYENPDDSTETFDYFRDYEDSVVPIPAMRIKQFEVNSTVKLSDNLTPGKTYKIKLDWDNVSNIKVHPETDNYNPSTGKLISLDIDYDADKDSGVWTLDDKYRKEFKLPKIGMSQVKLVGTDESTFKLPTHRSIYNNYFYGSITGGKSGSDFPESFDKYTGAFKMDANDTTPRSYTFDDFINEHSIDAEAIIAGIDTEGPVDIANIPSFTNMTTPVTVTAGGGDTVNGVAMPAWARVISSSGYIPANGGDNSVYYIDARSGDIDLQLGDGGANQTFTGTYVVYGDGHVTVTVPGNISGGSGQTIYLGSGGSPFSIMTEEIYSGKCKDTLVIGTPVSGQLGGELTTSPNIDWYFSSKTISTAKLATGGGGMTSFCGYIIAPSVFFDIQTNINGLKRDTYYYGDKIPSDTGNDKYTIFGSIFCKQYKGGQHAGVCYIPRDDGYVDDGSKPLLNKVGMYRSRS